MATAMISSRSNPRSVRASNQNSRPRVSRDTGGFTKPTDQREYRPGYSYADWNTQPRDVSSDWASAENTPSTSSTAILLTSRRTVTPPRVLYVPVSGRKRGRPTESPGWGEGAGFGVV